MYGRLRHRLYPGNTNTLKSKHSRKRNMLRKIQNFLLSPIFIIAVVLISIAFRLYSLPKISTDMEAGLFDWYGFILKRGFVNAFKENFALYTPPYLYLLALATLVNGVVSRVTLIKLISIFFDAVSAFFVYKIVGVKYPANRAPFLAAALAFTLPTVILNSSYWGQCDSIYTSFLLACIYFLLIERPIWAMSFFSLAFAFKLQAIFLLPFLGVYTLRRKIPWLSFALIPVIYVILSIPTIWAGRPWLDVLTIYAHQTDKFPKWSSTTPTMYLPLQGQVPITDNLSMLAVIGAVLIASIWIFASWRKQNAEKHNEMLLAALASVALVPFILPRMHQRYFYPQDLLSLVIVFFQPELWFLPIISQVVSVIAYAPFLFNKSFQLTILGAKYSALLYMALPLEVILLAVILWTQFRRPKQDVIQAEPPE
jgi:Gpi18-like mannosyltransferase